MAKVKVPERIVELTLALIDRYSCNNDYQRKLHEMLKDYELQESLNFRGDKKDVIFLRILNDLFAIRYYSELVRGYDYGIPDEKTAKRIKWYEQRSCRMYLGETYCENVTMKQKLKEVMFIKNLINKVSETGKFNRIVSISKNELKEMKKLTDISGDNEYVKIFMKTEKFSDEEIAASVENVLCENLELSELRFIEEAIEFLYPREITTYFVIF